VIPAVAAIGDQARWETVSTPSSINEAVRLHRCQMRCAQSGSRPRQPGRLVAHVAADGSCPEDGDLTPTSPWNKEQGTGNRAGRLQVFRPARAVTGNLSRCF
jgi:hypothetical protein